MKGKPIKTDSLTQNDIDKIAGLLDKTFDSRLAPLATKTFVEEKVKNLASKDDVAGLKSYIDEGVETIMDGIDNLAKLFADREKVERLEKWAIAVGEKVGLKLKI